MADRRSNLAERDTNASVGRLLKIREEREEGVRKRESGAIYSNLTPDSVALNNRHRLRWDWSPFNNGLLSNELVLSVRNAPGRAGDITAGKSVL